MGTLSLLRSWFPQQDIRKEDFVFVIHQLETTDGDGNIQLLHDMSRYDALRNQERSRESVVRSCPEASSLSLLFLHFGVRRSWSDIWGHSPSKGVNRSLMLLRAVVRESAS